MERSFVSALVHAAVDVLELAGVVVIVLGSAAALVVALSRLREGDTYRRLRHDIGRAILLGLELLVGADIIRSVGVSPTLRGIAVLALIVLVRTFLSVALTVELEGRWPWQNRGA